MTTMMTNTRSYDDEPPARLEQTGIFRARPIGLNIRRRDSGAVCISVRFLILEAWSDGDWEDWRELQEQEVWGDFYVVKRPDQPGAPGRIHPHAVEQLKHIGWDGRFESVHERSFEPLDCQITVKSKPYQGEVKYRAEWISAYDYVPPAFSGIDDEDVQSLDTLYGNELRALMGPKNQGAPPPRPRARRRAKADGEVEPIPPDASKTTDHTTLKEEDIPF